MQSFSYLAVYLLAVCILAKELNLLQNQKEVIILKSLETNVVWEQIVYNKEQRTKFNFNSHKFGLFLTVL